MTEIEDRLEELQELGLYRKMRLVSGPQGARVLLDGKPVLLLCSNNYLGLADHPRLREAAAKASLRFGTGAGASRLISGNMTLHQRLESALADLVGTQSALLFGSGYLLNAGVIPALARKGDVVFSDELNHASIIDGCKLAGAEVFVYRHCDTEHLQWGLKEAAGQGSLIVTDGVFSMDGDIAPLAEIVDLANRFDTRIMVDEAHAIGTIGESGGGLVAQLGLSDEVDVVAGTLGKALGSYGAFVGCDQPMRNYLVNSARSLIFSTALPPATAAAALAAVQLVRERPGRIDKLHSNATLLKRELASEGFDVGASQTHIVPLMVGDSVKAVELCEAALKYGVFAQAIRPPTVPDGSARLRLAATASHTETELVWAARQLAVAARKVGPDYDSSISSFESPETQAGSELRRAA